ncbi:MAG: MBL fold metallo-hydrolase [Pseudomonadota bacterium]
MRNRYYLRRAKHVLSGALIIASLSLWAKEPVPIEITQLSESLYYFKGHGGNVLISSGDDGVFMVDDQYATQQGPIREALASLSLAAPKFIINTHWHRDHAGGNEAFESSGALIIAHENVRARLSEEQYVAFFKSTVQPPSSSALPVVTFSERMQFHLNGDQLDVIHVPNAHTDGDALIYFRNDNVLHTGDVFFEAMYPFIDTSSGGSVNGVVSAINKALTLIDESTTIVPGHGPLSDRAGIVAYQKMLTAAHKRIAEMIIAGQSLEQIIAAKPTKEFDDKYASGFLKPDNFVRLLHHNIVHSTLQ